MIPGRARRRNWRTNGRESWGLVVRSEYAVSVHGRKESSVGDPVAPSSTLFDANLARLSVVNVSQVTTADKAELTRRIGKMPAGALDQGDHQGGRRAD